MYLFLSIVNGTLKNVINRANQKENDKDNFL